MVEHDFRESPYAECQLNSNAIGCPVISNTRQSICNLTERNHSKDDEEQAQASSLNFGMVKHAFRESLHAECQIDSNASGSAVISNTRQSICNLIERNRSKTLKNKPKQVPQISAWLRTLFESRSMQTAKSTAMSLAAQS